MVIRKKVFSKIKNIDLSKRQKIILAVVILSLGLFFSEYSLGKSGLYVSLFLSISTVILLFWSNFQDIKDNFSLQIFILPFLYSLAFALFYFLVPARLLTRIIMTSIYAIGLYSLFLCQNIFAVASIRTIALLSSARTTSFLITLVTYFFLANVIFSLHTNIFYLSGLFFIFSFLLIHQSIWTYTLEKSIKANFFWTFALALLLFETALIFWFWPSIPTVIALFMTGFFYMIVGLSHVWFDKRLFRGVLWEYIWVAVIVLLILIAFTSWTG